MRLACLLFLLYSSTLLCQADLHFTNHYTVKDGLCNASVYCIREDCKGFLWLATSEGLSRFDGYQFKSFFHSKYDPNSLPHNTIADILEYQPGMLLIATGNGLGVYNTWLNKFENERIQHPPVTSGNGAYVTKVNQDQDGNIWVNYNGEFDLLDSNLNFQYRLTDLEWARPLKGSQMFFEDWTIDPEGKIWIPTDNAGIQIVDMKNKTITNQKNHSGRDSFFEFNIIRALYASPKQDLVYVAPWGGGLYKYDLHDHTMQEQHFGREMDESNSVNSILNISDDQMYCISNGSLFEMNPKYLTYREIDSQSTFNEDALEAPVNPITLVKTKSGQIWIGAINGLFQLEKGPQQQVVSIEKLNGKSGCVEIITMPNGDVYSLYENGTLIKINSRNDEIKRYSISSSNKALLINQMSLIDGHEIWIATGNGIQIFDTRNDQFISIPEKLSQTRNLIVNTMHEDRDGDVWIATRQPFQLFCFHQAQNTVEKISDPVLSVMAAAGEFSRISAIVEDNVSNLWFRSVVGGGILQYDRKSKQWDHYPKKEKLNKLLGNKGIDALYPDGHGFLWISTTAGDGLIRYDWRKDSLIQFNREDGLISDHLVQILGHEDSLWLIGEAGYTFFDAGGNKIITQSWENITWPFQAALDTQHMEIIIGTEQKLIRFSSNTAHASNLTSHPMVDGIFINNKQVYIDPEKESLRLNQNQRNIRIDFTAPDFQQGEQLQFAYFLAGADTEWQYVKQTRSAQYASLSSGHYDFSIKVANADGTWSEPVQTFSFVIVPPIWKTPLFILGMICIMAIVTFLFVRHRVRNIRREARLKQKMAETEMMALRAQMNPHFIFNSLNSIDALIHSDDKYEATVYLNKFARLIRNVLDSSKNNTVPLTKDLETLNLYIELEKLRNENKFSCLIDVDPEVLKEDIRVPPLIIQPYVENAILHGLRPRDDDAGKLFISLKRINGHLHYKIEDNGVGRKHNKNGVHEGKASYGMQMSSDRIQLHNQEAKASVTIQDLEDHGKPSGTSVEIKIKVN